MKETNLNQSININSIQKDIEYIRMSMDANFQDHKEIKEAFKEALKSKVSISRFRIVELIVYTLAGSVLLSFADKLITLTKAIL